MTQHKFAASLNDNDPEEREWLDGISKSGMIPSHVIKDALRMYFGTGHGVTDYATNSDVIDTLNMGFAMLADKLDNIKVVNISQASQNVVTQMVTDGITGEQREIEAEVVPIDPDDNTPFIRGARNMAKPGMRYEGGQ